MEPQNTDNGVIKISEEVVSRIAALTVSDIDGVQQINDGFVGGITNKLFGSRVESKGIQVDMSENETSITVSIIVKFGCEIPAVAEALQNAIKTNIGKMTGLTVTNVHVNVDGVAKDAEEKTAEDQTPPSGPNRY
jgi:uncharacterized alkaline shock family protein YloU